MINIGLIGPGLIGKQVLKDIERVSGFKITGICNSKEFLVDNKEIKKCEKCDDIVDCFVKNLNKKYDKHLVIVDCTASLEIARKYPNWLKRGIDIVTPNKKGFSSELTLFYEIRNVCYYESTVGAGLPIISTIKDIIATGDDIIKIEGVLSGTLSYIFNEFCDNNLKFSEIVKRAEELGYTEPDPKDDLNGMDMARKFVILARLMGLNISIDDIYIENLIKEDQYFDKKKQDAISTKNVLRYTGCIENGKCEVKLGEYTLKHPFANIGGCDNIISIYTRRFNARPLVIMGAGAGAEVTSFGILCDLIKIKNRISGLLQATT
jgi:homoserine dehydrogenase